MGWGVWAHHMFVSGIGPISVAAFSMSTLFIAVPTGVKILNWLATMWGGKIKFTVAMLFAFGVVSMFTIGGLSGVTHSVAPADTQQTDTYYIVAHFHYVIFGGSLLGIFAGFYFWWPKVFGHLLSEKLGKWNFWLMIIGFNMTFGPMHILGLQGMSRRIDSYSPGFGFEFWNMFASIGSFIIALGVLVFVINVISSARRARHEPPVGSDPWDARSLEWFTPNPTPVHNFDELIQVDSLDELAPQVRRGREWPGRTRGHRRGGLPGRFRDRRPPAVALLLAVRPGRRLPLRRLRPHLHALDLHPGRVADPDGHLRLDLRADR